MMKILIGMGCGLVVFGVTLVMYCCLRAGAEEDRWLLVPPPQGKEEAGHGTETDTG